MVAAVSRRRPSPVEALRVLRGLYEIVRHPFADELSSSVAELGDRLARAVRANDPRAAAQAMADIHEWLLRMRHVISVRLESAFETGSADRRSRLPTGPARRRPK